MDFDIREPTHWIERENVNVEKRKPFLEEKKTAHTSMYDIMTEKRSNAIREKKINSTNHTHVH